MALVGALIQAADDGDVARVRQLAAQGADVNQRDGDGWTALHVAAQNGHVEVTSALITLGVNKEAQLPTNGWRPLHVAAVYGQVEVIKTLVASGADKEAKAAAGWRPLHAAAFYGFVAAAKVLLQLGAELKAQATAGYTAHGLSLQGGRQQMAEVLEAAAQSRSAVATATTTQAGACAACGGSSSPSGTAFMRCSRCKAVKYCSALCQRTHWPVHKASCAAATVDPAQAVAGAKAHGRERAVAAGIAACVLITRRESSWEVNCTALTFLNLDSFLKVIDGRGAASCEQYARAHVPRPPRLPQCQRPLACRRSAPPPLASTSSTGRNAAAW